MAVVTINWWIIGWNDEWHKPNPGLIYKINFGWMHFWIFKGLIICLCTYGAVVRYNFRVQAIFGSSWYFIIYYLFLGTVAAVIYHYLCN